MFKRKKTHLAGGIEKNRKEKNKTTTTVVVKNAAADAVELNFLQAVMKPTFSRGETFYEVR